MIIDEAMRAEGLDSHLRLEVNDLATLLDLVAADFRPRARPGGGGAKPS